MITITKTNVSVLSDGGKQLGHFDTDHMCKMISVQKNKFNYLKLINVNATITAPLHWWIEYKDFHKNKKYKDDDVLFDYKTYWLMFKDPFEPSMFDMPYKETQSFKKYIELLNNARCFAIAHDNLDTYKQLVSLLPLGYEVTLDVKLNYENLYRIYKSFNNTTEENWLTFINWIDELPYNYIFTEK